MGPLNESSNDHLKGDLMKAVVKYGKGKGLVEIREVPNQDKGR